MFIDGQNALQKPSAVADITYESKLAEFKQIVVNHIAAIDATMAAQVEETLNNEAELSTKIIEACLVVLQTHARDINEKALQMFAYWAQKDNLDVKVSDLGLERQELQAADDSAFPPVPAVYEDDDHLKTRYYLAPYSFSNAGPGLGYKYHTLTLDARPTVSVESLKAGKVVVTYQFDPSSLAAQVKDAKAFNVYAVTGDAQDRGKVKIAVLGRDGDGTPSAEVLAAVNSYYVDREDTAPLTDQQEVVAATIVNYKFRAIAYIHKGPDTSVVEQSAQVLLTEYADRQHKIGATVEPSRLDQYLHEAGAVKIEKLEPLNPIVTTDEQAPYCTDIEIEVRTL